MYLRDLQLGVSSAADLPPSFSLGAIRASVHAVIEGYLDELPRRKVVLGGAAKVCVQLGPRPAEGIFSHADFGNYPDGVGWIWMPSFDFCALAQADVEGQQVLLLNALHDGLMEFARRTKSDTQVFLNARASLFARPWPLPEIPRQELLARWGLLPKAKRKKPGVRSKRKSSQIKPPE
jgi:hypothetical protein